MHTWVEISNIFYFHPEKLWKIGEDEAILTSIFQRGWFNQQLDTDLSGL